MLGAVNGNTITMPLVPYSMARNNLFPLSKIIGKVSKNDTPANAIVFQGLIASLMVVFFNVDRITDIAMFSMYMFYSLIFVGLFKLRKLNSSHASVAYKVPMYPLIPILAIIGSVYVCYSMIVQNPYDGLGAIAVAVIGYPVYAWLTRQQ
jgi:APA family basic amino acid/polyamine antiporter